MINNIKIKKFLKKLENNAPLSWGNNFKYPYKPILLMSILKNVPIELLFNENINIEENEKIVRTYYDLLTNDISIIDALQGQSSKREWFIGFNDIVKKKMIKSIFEMPAKKLLDEQNDFWNINSKDKIIKLNIELDNLEQATELRDLLMKCSLTTLKKCIPVYEGLNELEIFDYTHYQFSLLEIDDSILKSGNNPRRYQYIFAKIVKDRDERCKICCIELPELLDACHIKPYSMCEHELEKYDDQNGITMCKNHHTLYDRGLFTFDNKWNVIICDKLLIEDQNLFFKVHEPCWMKLKSTYAYENEYSLYHSKNIFK